MSDSSIWSTWLMWVVMVAVVILAAAVLLLLVNMAAQRILKLAVAALGLVKQIKDNTACVGNVLRQDDAFGIAVVQHLAMRGGLPVGMRLLESGIAGIRLVQELMEGYDGLIVVDAMVRKEAAGKISVLEADVPDRANCPLMHATNFWPTCTTPTPRGR
ncbi:MAG: hydrogenase maturation protease [Anaerolineae bacterium]|nr:hydrogenase maturation protease [Anaerolineae bacterium]